jgi:glycosyltransferase involved in cell wall biosynthesis
LPPGTACCWSSAYRAPDVMRVLLCLPPARVSNELDLFLAMPGTELTVVSDHAVPLADRSVVLPARRVPVLGGSGGWTAAPAWLSGLPAVDPGAVDLVASLELLSFGSRQAAALARRLKVPHAVTVFETLADNPLYRFPPWRGNTRRTVASADLFVCFTARAAAHAVALGCLERQCVVVHPGIDVEQFRPRARGRDERPRVMFVGMLRADRGADKGVLDVVDAVRRLASEIDGLQLRLVGEGPLGPPLVARAAAEPLLEVLGRRPRHELPALLRTTRVLVLASRRTAKWEEQFGFVLVEAMASGLPVVATISGAIPEVVPSWNPLVPERDVVGLAEGIRAALGSDGDEWGQRNRAHALEHFDLRRQGEALAEALDRLRGEGPAHAGGRASPPRPAGWPRPPASGP